MIEVDENFKLSDLYVDGGTVTFLVDSDGHIHDSKKPLESGKEYSTHIVPEGKETVKVTYINGKKELEIKYQKGAGLLFLADPTKKGYVFIGWKNKETGTYLAFMTPVLKDMVLIAQFELPGKKEISMLQIQKKMY